MNKKKKRKPSLAQYKKFAKEYLLDFNATRAAERAGYSPKTAYAQGHRLLKNAEIKQLLEAEAKRQIEKTDIKIAKVLKELERVAFSDITNCLEFSASGVILKNSNDLGEDITGAISEASQTETKDGGTVKVKMHDKIKALALLTKYLDMEKSKIELSGPDGELLPINVIVELVGNED